MDRTATFDATGHYRYRLTRRWQPDGPCLTFVMLNPSRADHEREDPTLRRCIHLAQGWGYGGLVVVNLFAYCTAYPRELRHVVDPIGPENDAYLLPAVQQGDRCLLAWGNQGRWRGRDQAVLELLALGDRACIAWDATRPGARAIPSMWRAIHRCSPGDEYVPSTQGTIQNAKLSIQNSEVRS
jgi:hypothetical protein